MANGTSVPIKGTGKAAIGDLILTKVYYVPSFKKNLISAGRLMEDGYTASLTDGYMTITKRDDFIATACRDPISNLLKFEAPDVTEWRRKKKREKEDF